VCRTSLRSRLPCSVQSLSCLGVREVHLRRVRVLGLLELVVLALGVQGVWAWRPPLWRTWLPRVGCLVSAASPRLTP
ncbi:unnamed protein product, partial [Closterium sp. NIES-53]